MRSNPADTTPTLLARLHRFGVHNGGTTAVVAAILFPVVVGALGLGAETGYWYLTQRKLQHIADVSAHAAGARLRANDTNEQIEAAAKHVAYESGYRGTQELVVNLDYTSEKYPGALLVEVVATDEQPRLFSAVVAGFFSKDPEMTVTMNASAVAMVDSSSGSVACVLALDPNAPRAVTMDGSGSVGLQGCDIASNSNAADALYATSTVSTDCAYSVGGAHAPGLATNVCDGVKVNAPLIRDPYKDVTAPTNWTNCSGKNQGHPTQASPNLTPRCFSGGLTVKGALHFEPGLYIIDGGEFNVNAGDNSKLTGEGVTFYLANGAKLNIGGSIQMNFSAPGPGKPYAGILFFGDRTATATTHTLAGNSASTYNGAVYTPASAISFAGNSKATGGCTQIVSATVKFTGASTLQSSCENAGTTDIVTNERVELVE
jgi:Flp pilus assembly protein TadG